MLPVLNLYNNKDKSLEDKMMDCLSSLTEWNKLYNEAL